MPKVPKPSEEFQRHFDQELCKHKYKNQVFIAAVNSYELEKNVQAPYCNYNSYLVVIKKTK